MNKHKLIFIANMFLFSSGYAQRDSLPADAGRIFTENKKIPVYKLSPKVDIPVIIPGTVWSAYAFTKIYKKDPSTPEEIENLKTSDINAFDRWAVYPYSKNLDNISYYPFYASIPLPFIFFLTGKETRSDFFKLSFLYWETMSVTGLFGTGSTYFVNRYRPYAYSAETPMDKRTGGIAKNSFYCGHAQVVAASTFFIAQVYANYHPGSKIKWVYYGIASAATGTTAWLRLKGGEHFPSDIILGSTMGALAGILVPHLHKNKLIKNTDLGILPVVNDEFKGFALTYKLK